LAAAFFQAERPCSPKCEEELHPNNSISRGIASKNGRSLEGNRKKWTAISGGNFSSNRSSTVIDQNCRFAGSKTFVRTKKGWRAAGL
jgi:hypothetical protein